jgi:hypothetical protein
MGVNSNHEQQKQVQGITTIAPEVIRKIPEPTLGLKIYLKAARRKF